MKTKTVTPLFILLIAFALSAVAQPTVPKVGTAARPVPSAPELGANSYMLVDFHSGRVLVEENADLQVEPASITKLMTAYVVFSELSEGNINLDDLVPVSERAWKTGGSRMFIEPGMEVTAEQLIRGMVIQSGNDASVALAEFVAGSEEAFASLMNHFAEQLGMPDTSFRNSTGLPDPEHYTTARDIVTLSIATIRDFPDFYTWYAEKEFTFNNIRQHNRNTLLWRDPAIDGLKTGHTEAAGYCLAASAMQDGMRLVSAVMGSSSESSRASESQTLLNYGFRFYETAQLYEAGQELAKARVWKGLSEDVQLGIAEELYVTIPRGRYSDLNAEIQLQPQLIAPLAEGQPVGVITISLDGEAVAERQLLTLAAVEQAGFVGSTWDGLKLWVNGFFEDDANGESD